MRLHPMPTASRHERPHKRLHKRSTGGSTVLPLAIIGLFALVAFAYSLVVPPFETPDELYHYGFARHLALGNGLPVMTGEADGPWRQEGAQAPLYYFLLSRLIAPVDHSDFEAVAQINARANLGDPLYPGNKNFMLYSSRALPLQGTNLALHIGRWFSICLSALTLWFTYRIARRLFPAAPHLAVLALLIPATLPQFAFISASVNNDVLVTLLCTATLYMLVSLLSRPRQQAVSWRDWALLGTLLGLAALSKLTGLGLLPLTGLALVGLAWQRSDWGLLARAAPILAALVALIAGWWYWRNYALYGDPLAAETLLVIEGLRTSQLTWQHFWGELRGLRYSFWGLFGWFSILLPSWIYTLLDGVMLLAAAGWLLALVKNWPRRPLSAWLAQGTHLAWLCVAAWGGLLWAFMLYWLTFAMSSQGRLLFPGLAAYSILLVLGLHRFFAQVQRLLRLSKSGPRLARGAVAPLYLLPVGLVATSVYALLVLLPQSYRAAPPVSAIPASAERVGRIYDGKFEVVAVDVPPGPYRNGAKVPVTLYLRKLQRSDANYQLFVQLLDTEYKEIANVTTHPGWGKNPTALWEVGAIYADSYDLQLLREVKGDAPIEARLYVGFMDGAGQLLDVPGYDWDIASRTIDYVLIDPNSD